ncbi:hypothetical protein AYI69_g1697 [Smittium culicis]|uniref:Uncharacterized protein n=1 Tax=Smittium culicis TaxID=133412 RepID=A0A1R1YPQ3_9FUNG|nr:hypothetical protein AYI69_g1697 [Smittium culicis]
MNAFKSNRFSNFNDYPFENSMSQEEFLSTYLKKSDLIIPRLDIHKKKKHSRSDLILFWTAAVKFDFRSKANSCLKEWKKKALSKRQSKKSLHVPADHINNIYNRNTTNQNFAIEYSTQTPGNFVLKSALKSSKIQKIKESVKFKIDGDILPPSFNLSAYNNPQNPITNPTYQNISIKENLDKEYLLRQKFAYQKFEFSKKLKLFKKWKNARKNSISKSHRPYTSSFSNMNSFNSYPPKSQADFDVESSQLKNSISNYSITSTENSYNHIYEPDLDQKILNISKSLSSKLQILSRSSALSAWLNLAYSCSKKELTFSRKNKNKSLSKLFSNWKSKLENVKLNQIRANSLYDLQLKKSAFKSLTTFAYNYHVHKSLNRKADYFILENKKMYTSLYFKKLLKSTSIIKHLYSAADDFNKKLQSTQKSKNSYASVNYESCLRDCFNIWRDQLQSNNILKSIASDHADSALLRKIIKTLKTFNLNPDLQNIYTQQSPNATKDIEKKIADLDQKSRVFINFKNRKILKQCFDYWISNVVFSSSVYAPVKPTQKIEFQNQSKEHSIINSLSSYEDLDIYEKKLRRYSELGDPVMSFYTEYSPTPSPSTIPAKNYSFDSNLDSSHFKENITQKTHSDSFDTQNNIKSNKFDFSKIDIKKIPKPNIPLNKKTYYSYDPNYDYIKNGDEKPKDETKKENLIESSVYSEGSDKDFAIKKFFINNMSELENTQPKNVDFGVNLDMNISYDLFSDAETDIGICLSPNSVSVLDNYYLEPSFRKSESCQGSIASTCSSADDKLNILSSYFPDKTNSGLGSNSMLQQQNIVSSFNPDNHEYDNMDISKNKSKATDTLNLRSHYSEDLKNIPDKDLVNHEMLNPITNVKPQINTQDDEYLKKIDFINNSFENLNINVFCAQKSNYLSSKNKSMNLYLYLNIWKLEYSNKIQPLLNKSRSFALKKCLSKWTTLKRDSSGSSSYRLAVMTKNSNNFYNTKLKKHFFKNLKYHHKMNTNNHRNYLQPNISYDFRSNSFNAPNRPSDSKPSTGFGFTNFEIFNDSAEFAPESPSIYPSPVHDHKHSQNQQNLIRIFGNVLNNRPKKTSVNSDEINPSDKYHDKRFLSNSIDLDIQLPQYSNALSSPVDLSYGIFKNRNADKTKSSASLDPSSFSHLNRSEYFTPNSSVESVKKPFTISTKRKMNDLSDQARNIEQINKSHIPLNDTPLNDLINSGNISEETLWLASQRDRIPINNSGDTNIENSDSLATQLTKKLQLPINSLDSHNMLCLFFYRRQLLKKCFNIYLQKSSIPAPKKTPPVTGFMHDDYSMFYQSRILSPLQSALNKMTQIDRNKFEFDDDQIDPEIYSAADVFYLHLLEFEM